MGRRGDQRGGGGRTGGVGWARFGGEWGGYQGGVNDEGNPLEPGYDHLPIGILEYRLRRLDAERLREVRDYEARHAAREPVLSLIEKRLALLEGNIIPA